MDRLAPNFQEKIQYMSSAKSPKPKGVLCPSYFNTQQTQRRNVVDAQRSNHGPATCRVPMAQLNSSAGCALSSFDDEEFYSFPPPPVVGTKDVRLRNGPGYQVQTVDIEVIQSTDAKSVSIHRTGSVCIPFSKSTLGTSVLL